MEKEKLPLPSKAQQKWQDLEMGMFIHFGMNTFRAQEWGDGTDDPSHFHPTQLDCKQWARTAKQAGFSYCVLTAKHHDGFCLWPTKTTSYSVASSPWKNGDGDVVREFVEACKEEGLGYGLYLSPWDRNAPCYSDEEAYNDFYAAQLTELTTQYGQLVELWFDGAGSEGRRYDWQRIMAIVNEQQPDAMVFNMGAPTVRWAGNEDGVAPYPCWNAAEQAKVSMFTKDMTAWLPETSSWVPAECNAPIRKLRWFWRPNDEDTLRTADELMDMYYRSVGHGAQLMLNIAPDDRGLMPQADCDVVFGFSQKRKDVFHNMVGETSGQGPVHEVVFEQPQEVNHFILQEDISFGERIRAYKLEALIATGDWELLVEGSAVGHKKIDRIPTVRSTHFRLTVLDSLETPQIQTFKLYG
ncbi:alpha-L-fucosidase [Aureibacillus halotolerans]|uniref:alpha-L-fucosidase n=1 Tax=Aureibacillus halotolerans TaxID=1508390 RepID=A0A4R6U8P2_9BACI|nr:alpha-L-fucosidase [Aureibacillus halotolerans]TDQ42771.1 alpha-L-fucosidase [Aureibacillus halotolerans]